MKGSVSAASHHRGNQLAQLIQKLAKTDKQYKLDITVSQEEHHLVENISRIKNIFS